MRRLLPLSLLLLGTTAFAQDEEPGFFGRLFGGGEAETESTENPGSFLERLIEDNLSGEGRDVSVVGFQGLLFGEATMEALTISDADGVWLRLEGIKLDWSRAALLRGRLNVAELSAESIALPRLPLPQEAGPPSPEASGFSLPQLPVSVDIGRVAAERVEIGAPVYGEETVASLEGAVRLADGEGSATLAVERLDATGSLALDASYSNDTQNLAVDLSLAEGPDGIVATLADLPGGPSLSFSVAGEDPITAFTAEIALATDGAERLAGTVQTQVPEGIDGASLQIGVDIGGDIAPVFLPEYQTFFGDDIALVTQMTTFEDGRFLLDELTLDAGVLSLSGRVDIGADGLPDRLDIEGAIADTSGAPVLLPLSGPETRVDEIVLDVDFDADARDRWFGVFEITGLDRPDFSADSLLLDGTGQISGDLSDASVSANLLVEAENLDLGNETATEVVGERVTGGADITWATGDPLRLTGLAINGETYNLGGYATVRTGGDGIDAFGQVTVNAEDLSAFSGVAQRDLGGSASLETTFSAQPLAGFFDVEVAGSTTDLVISQPQADSILAGQARLEASAVRDTTGIRADLTTLETPNARISGQADLKTGGSSVSLSANLADASLVSPDLSGPLQLEANARQATDLWQWDASGGLDGTRFDASGTATDVFGTPAISAEGSLSVDELANFATLVNRDIGGAVRADFSGDVIADLSSSTVTLNATTTDLRIDQEQADALLSGPVRITLDGGYAGGILSLKDTRISGQNLNLEANGTIGETAGDFAVSGRINDATLLLSDAPEGVLEFNGKTVRDGRDWTFDVEASAPSLVIDAEGAVLDPTGPATALEGKVIARADDLGVFSGLANRPLSGTLDVDVEGGLSADLAQIDLDGSISGNGLSIGQPQADRLLAGNLALNVDANRNGNTLDIGTLSLSTSLLKLDAKGRLGTEASQITLDARLADVAPFVQGFSGPVAVKGTLGQDGIGTNFVTNLSIDGPTQATLSGKIAQDFSSLDLTIEGTAPIGLANQFIQPRSIAGTVGFDLAVKGPPAVESVSGVLTTSGARFVDPATRIDINDISGNVTLEQGRAIIAIAMAPRDGGQISVEGPISLSPPLNADLAIDLNSAVFVDPRVIQTRFDGEVTLTGPLQNGARIGGAIVVGTSTITIPSSSLGGAGAIPDIIHVNEPAAVRDTRRRAGLIKEDTGVNPDAGPEFPLDIRISAPGQIFVRGRGLDAEFEGDIRVTGTTKNVVPIGEFSLVRGHLDILGQRLDIEEATITMQGSFEPVLNVVGTSETDGFKVNVIVSGPATNPDIAFTSEPDLPEEEVLARLLFGEDLDSLSPFQAARLALAVRTLSGQSSGDTFLGGIREGAGLADLDVRVGEDGGTEVSAGVYLNDRTYSDVTFDEDGETILNLNFELTPSVTITGSTSSDDEASIGIFFERDY